MPKIASCLLFSITYFIITKQVQMRKNTYSFKPVKCGGKNLIVFYIGMCLCNTFFNDQKKYPQNLVIYH